VPAGSLFEGSEIMDTKFTPGPWHTKKLASCTAIETNTESRITHLFDHQEYEGEPCGSIESQDKTQEEIDANARLIAAAPLLYEACKEAEEASRLAAIHDGPDGELLPWYKQLLAAIAAAEKGE